MKSIRVTLIKNAYASDEIGQKTTTETRRPVFAKVSSVTQTEFFEAGRNGFKPQYRAEMYLSEYHGEEICEINGKRFGIYRTFEPSGDRIELYLEEKSGV